MAALHNVLVQLASPCCFFNNLPAQSSQLTAASAPCCHVGNCQHTLHVAVQAKQRETGYDMDARLLMYADAIERTQQRAFSKSGPDAAAAKADCSTHAMPQLHVNTRRAPLPLFGR